MSTLYIVATPIGNLEDISFRAVRILGEVALIAAEDTRHTRKLLAYYHIKTPTTSYFEQNKLDKMDRVLAALEQGDVALVSDAGTPALNDPGYELVRAALAAGHTVTPIPGPSAPLAALVASGLPTDAFLYLGYLPRRSEERRKFLSNVASQPYTLIFLETPHRLLESLQDMLQLLGDRPIAVARELTKLHEEIFRGSLSQAAGHFTQQAPRGEFTLVIGGYQAAAEVWNEDRLFLAVKEKLVQGEAAAQIASDLAGKSGWRRREIYRLVTELAKND